jgi:hypothetical protein
MRGARGHPAYRSARDAVTKDILAMAFAPAILLAGIFTIMDKERINDLKTQLMGSE